MKQIHSIFTKSLLVVMLTMTTQTAWADDLTSANLQIDSEIAVGTAGHYYYLMPGYTQGNTVHHTLTISEQDITDGKATFKVYDNGGKGGNYGYTIRAYLTITAPEGKVVKVNGTVITYTDGSWGDFMYIYDGADNTAPKIRNGDSEKFCSQGYKSAVDVQSSNNSITLYFETDGQSGTIAAGLDLTVEINDPTYDIRKAAVTGIQSEYSYTGSVIPINYSVHAYSTNELLTKGTHYTETITKGDKAADVIEEGDYTVTITGKSPYYGSQSFDFTVWKSLTQDGSEWYITIPTKRKRTLTITQADIAAGITAFKVYHAGGKERVWGKNWDGVLAINVPDGYLIQLSGVVRAAKYTNNELTINGILTVYDNNEASGTTLLENTNLVYDNNNIASATIPSNVLSTGHNMAIRYQVENDYTDIDLTATLIPDDRKFNITVSNSITGGSVTSNLSQAKGNDEVTLTVTPDEGYMLNELTVTDADGGTVNVTDCNWYTDWSNKTSKTATFSMPTKAVTVAATFTSILSSADGGLYVNMPHAGTKNVIIPDNITSFKLYDDGGKDGVFQCYSNGTMVITAPSGKLLQISGKSFLTNSLVSGHSNYVIYNGTPENSGDQMAYNNQEQEVTLSPVVSEGNTIYVSFSASDNNDLEDNKYGLDMTVEVITPGEYNISIDNGIEHGSVSLDKTQATNNETVNVTVTPDEGYVLKEISVSDAGGAIAMTKPATDQWGDAVYYTATNGYSFKMRSSDATVTATFMPKTDFYVNMPKTDQRDFTIPDGTTSFKVYDNSGKNESYTFNDDGKLLLTAPEGYVMNVSGYVKLYYSSDDQDYLDIYDGNSTSATSLGRFKDTSGNNNTFTQTLVTATSSTNQMLLHFVTNGYGYASPGGGVYLTVTLVPKEYSITYNGVEGATFSTTYDSYTIESAAITLDTPSKTGYDFSGWYDNSGLTGDAVTTIAAGSTGDVVLWAKWTAIEYNITYNGVEGATFATANPTTYTIESDAITLTNPTKDGYSFAGWTGTGLTEATTTVTIAHGSTGDKSYTATWTASTYAVTVTAGENMTKTSGEASQTVNAGDAMTDVVYTANEGYYFPTDYSVDAVNGVSVTRNSYTQITVSGSPTAAAEITLTAPTAKTKPDAPATPTAVNCTTADNNDGKLTGVMADMEYKKSDAESWMDGTGSDITGLTPGTYYVRIKATDTTLASDNQELTIAAYVVTTYIVTVTDGTGGGDYEAGASVTIIANDPAAGWQFKEWTGADGLTFTDGSATTATATFTMPSADVTVTATWKKLLTITADSDSKEYDGSTLTKNSYTSEGLLEGDVIESVTISGCQAAVGTSDNVPSAAVIKNGDTNVTANYSITYVNGTLTVTAKQIESESGTIVTQDENGYSVTVDERNGSGAVINGTVLDANGEVSVASLDYDRPLSVPTETDKDVTIGGEPAKLYTTCLPTIPTANANVKYYTLASVSGTTLHFTEVTSPAADTPYLMAVTGSSSVNEDVTASNVTLKKTVTGSTANGYTMMGTQTGLMNSDAKSAASIVDNATYILQAGSKWGKVTDKAGVYIPPFRAYITGPKVKASSARQMNSSFGDDDATGIDSIRTTDADDTERWYDLNGRRIDKPNRKGLYIRNGKVTTTTD